MAAGSRHNVSEGIVIQREIERNHNTTRAVDYRLLADCYPLMIEISTDEASLYPNYECR